MATKRTKSCIIVVTFTVAVTLLIFLESCNNFLLQNKTSVNVELPSNLYEVLSSKTITDRKTSDSDAFILTATMSGSVTQNQIKEITNVSEPLSIVFSDVPFNSVITVEITISRDNIVLYSGKSQPTTITNTDTSIEVTLSAKIYPMGTELPNIKIGLETYDKTSEIIIIPKGTTGNVHKTDDSSWDSYYDGGGDDRNKGVFIAERNVTLSPFVMGKYEVTQELYQAVIGTNPSEFQGDSNLPVDGEKQELRPVEKVSWYNAVVFCNKLTEQTMGKDNCVYYTDGAFTVVYESGDSGVIIYMNPEKKGYRLPTEAEWEYAARGGNPSVETWGYAYAGVQTKKTSSKFTSTPLTDNELNTYGWYAQNPNTSGKTHEVGKLEPNTLGLYDMSGNVYEWCYDKYNSVITPDNVTNPIWTTSGAERVRRGGGYNSDAYYCSVSYRSSNTPPSSGIQKNLGFRVCRSQ